MMAEGGGRKRKKGRGRGRGCRTVEERVEARVDWTVHGLIDVSRDKLLPAEGEE